MLLGIFRLTVTGLLLGLFTVFAGAFVLPAQQPLLPTQQHRPFASFPLMAGFGAASSSKGNAASKKKKAPSKLKPKKQWDRYKSDDLKSADAVRVAVRVVGRGPEEKWFSSGEVKSAGNAHTEAAVVRHRALIADHARRMFPFEVLALDDLEFGYTVDAEEDTDACEWRTVGKVGSMPDDIDKMIGFRGFPDLTGFYSSSGKAATGNTKQDGYSSMKNKGVGNVQRLEIHD